MSLSLNGKKNEHRYECKICDFVCCYKSNYDIHLSTRKHITMVKNEELAKDTTHPVISSQVDTSTTETIHTCKYCNKRYAHLSGLSRHKKMCITPKLVNHEDSVTTLDDTMPINDIIRKPPNNNLEKNNDNTNQDLVAENREMRVMMMTLMTTHSAQLQTLMTNNTQLQSQMLEMMKASQITATNPTATGIASNVTGDHNAVNSHNNTFNMNMFLNEKCKDAMNMKDFVNSIQLNMTDLENVVRLGYVEGMSNIFIDNLQKTDIYKRPVHCSDVKRETLYVKENDQWEREEPNHPKMVNAVLAVEQKNVVLVNEWAKANPRCMNSSTRENETYFRLSKVVTDGEKDGNIDKVIRKVAKKVTIEKGRSGLSIEDE